MGKIRIDERGRILIPSEERSRLRLKPRAEFELMEEGGILLLKPVVPKPIKVQSGKKKWGEEAFLPAGEATFGE